MLTLSGRYGHNRLPIAEVMVSGDPADTQEKVVQWHHFRALFDTGASRSAISQKVVAICKPEFSGRATIAPVANEPKRVNTFAFSLGLIMQKENGAEEIRNIPTGGYGLHTGNLFDVIIGLDVICLGTFCISKDGTFEFIL